MPFIAPNVAWSTQAALISATGSLPCNNTCAVIIAVIDPAEAAPIESMTRTSSPRVCAVTRSAARAPPS